MNTIITGTGCALPALLVPNSHFDEHLFYDKNGVPTERQGAAMASKLEAITGIRERRYVPFDQDSVPLMAEAAERAVENSGLNVNDLDGIIVAHNAGNMVVGEKQFHPVPNMAARLKHALKLSTYECFAYDLLFGCPGWIQGLVQAHQAIQNGDAQHVLVVGLEVASRMLDPHDPDSMILADGCGAVVLSANSGEKTGILSYATYSHALEDLNIIYLDKSNNPLEPGSCYFHMHGKEVYKYATQWVPKVVKKALDKAGLDAGAVDLFLFHQANEKMIQAISNNLAQLYGMSNADFEDKVPTTVQFLGNTSVASIPTLLDLILNGRMERYKIRKGRLVVMASVGAGMHCNALVYQF